jgi:hypothetical protein
MLSNHSQGLGSIPSLGDNGHVVLGLHVCYDAMTHYRVIVRHQNPNLVLIRRLYRISFHW